MPALKENLFVADFVRSPGPLPQPQIPDRSHLRVAFSLRESTDFDPRVGLCPHEPEAPARNIGPAPSHQPEARFDIAILPSVTAALAAVER